MERSLNSGREPPSLRFDRLFMDAALSRDRAMTDAFNVAFRIPNLFRRMFAEGAFSQAFIPVLAATHARDGHEATQALVDKVASVMVWVLLLVCAVGVMAAPLMAREKALTIDVVGELISKPYIEITLNLMQRFGVTVERAGWSAFTISPGQHYRSPGTMY
eukprot:gene17034-23114_t